TLRNVAAGALCVVDLRQVVGSCVALEIDAAGGEIHIVVAGTASRAARLLQPGAGLRRAVLRVVAASRAIPRIARVSRVYDRRKVGISAVSVDLVRHLADAHARQARAPVDL